MFYCLSLAYIQSVDLLLIRFVNRSIYITNFRLKTQILFQHFFLLCKFYGLSIQYQLLQLSDLKIIILSGRILDNTGFIWQEINSDPNGKTFYANRNCPEHSCLNTDSQKITCLAGEYCSG